ncbi:putative homoserine dehydrogenase-like protein [Paenibacillus mucilaginosus]|uniref:hypothetical protein n=1 Tax=Paenibacillus mucilaginosus TaxID=61624 RepID=UPI003D1F813E
MYIAVFVPVKEDVVQAAQIFVGEYAQRDAELAFLAHTNVYYELFLQAEEHRPYHLTSLETPLSVAGEYFYNEQTIAPWKGMIAESVTIAKKDLQPGTVHFV